MRVALLANTAWLDEELARFRHLVVGLIDEQCRVVQVVPDALDMDEFSVFGEQLAWEESHFAPVNWARIRQLGEPLRRLKVDVIHALDGGLWWPAVSLAQRLETNLVLQANAAEDMEQLERVVRLAPTRRLSFAATTEPIAAAIDEQLEERIPVASLPPGVHAEKQSPTPREPENPLSAVVSGNGRLDTQYAGLLQAMVQIIDRYPQTQFFFDGQGSDQHRLWREAERLHLLPNMSFIPRRLGHREMLLRADVLIQPQALNRSRSLTLQAMARGVPILAQRDRWLDYLIPEWTAYVLDESSPEGWVYLLTRLIEEPELGQKLGESAQQWVSENRLAADQIGRALELYQRISGAPAASSR